MHNFFVVFSLVFAIFFTCVLVGKMLEFCMKAISKQEAKLRPNYYWVCALWWGLFFGLVFCK